MRSPVLLIPTAHIDQPVQRLLDARTDHLVHMSSEFSSSTGSGPSAVSVSQVGEALCQTKRSGKMFRPVLSVGASCAIRGFSTAPQTISFSRHPMVI
jgi:hypothetical protein